MLKLFKCIYTDTYPGFNLYKRNSCSGSSYDKVQNDFTFYSVGHNESLCNMAVLWCVSNASAGSMLEWDLSNSTLSSGAIKLCLCTYNNYMTGCYRARNEGVFKCIQSSNGGGTNISSTLQFTHSVYNVSSNEICTIQTSLMTVTETPHFTLIQTMSSKIELEKTSSSVSPSANIEKLSAVPSLSLSSLALSSASYTTIECSIENFSTISLLPTSSYSTSSTVSPVSVQSSSTVPHYAGIGLLVATNLLTLIALISSCVYIFCQRKKSKL